MTNVNWYVRGGMTMKIGYSYWGYLGDTKYDKNGKMASTPDGNAIYSWSIIYQLMKEGHQVYQIMPDRDYVGLAKEGSGLFSWCTNQRMKALTEMVKLYKVYTDWSTMTKTDLFDIWDNKGLNECEVILHEWRMFIPGRNDDRAIQPDYFIQEALIEYCARHGITLIIFDLDYKITEEEYNRLLAVNSKTYLFELGYKWGQTSVDNNFYHVEIPFSFDYINEFPLERKDNQLHIDNLVYVGNRYERDWCIDKYIPTEMDGVTVYGNWLESGRDSADKWPNIEFGPRVQTADMPEIYQNSLATILLAKKEYLEYSFMTARIIEAVFYGCVPLFIEEYGDACIKKYAGIYSQDLTVSSKSDIINIVYYLRYNDSYRRNVLSYLREHLKFMDVKHFVNKLYYVVEREKKNG